MRIAIITAELSGINLLDKILGISVVVFFDGNQKVLGNLGLYKNKIINSSQMDNKNLFNFISNLSIDLIISFRSLRILSDYIISFLPYGAFNVHFGPLPHYAGVNAQCWAIFNGEKKHGVTLHRIDEGIDTGDIVYIESFDLSPNETGLSITSKCVRIGKNLVIKLVENIKNGIALPRHSQDKSLRHYFSKDAPNDCLIDWYWTAIKIDRLVRAANFYPFQSPWNTAKTIIKNKVYLIFNVGIIDGFLKPGELVYKSNGEIYIGSKKGIIQILDYKILIE